MLITVNSLHCFLFFFLLSYTKINSNTKNKTNYLQTYEQGLDEFDTIKLRPLNWDSLQPTEESSLKSYIFSVLEL